MKVRHSWHPSETSALAAALETPEVSPLGGELSGAPSEAEVHRMWQSLRERPVPSRVRPLGIAFALTTLVAALALVVWLRLEPAGPLLARGAQLPSTLVSEKAPAVVELSDGSRITLDADGRIDVLGNDKRTFVTTLRRGTAHFEVEPGGPRRWVVEAGLVSVEVVGTGFTVERGDDQVTVTVDHGVVLVRGEFPGSERRLTAGQSLVARGKQDGRVDQALLPPPGGAQRPAGLPSDAAGSDVAGPGVAPPTTLDLAQGPDSARGLGSAQGPAVATSASSTAAAAPARVGSDASPRAPRVEAVDAPRAKARATKRDLVDESLRAADEARRTGDADRAAELYAQAAGKAADGDPRRGMAALSYARTSKNPARAAELLEASLDSMPPGLVEPAWAHLAELHGRAGHLQEARAFATRYLERYPTHPRAEKVKRWLDTR
jgi:transmembrane sensor